MSEQAPLTGGRLSIENQKWIKENASRLTADEIASKLNRNPETIRKWIQKNCGIELTKEGGFQDPTELGVIQKLITRPEFKQLQHEFTEPEIERIKNQYVSYALQFKDDIKPTEETQIFMLVKIEVLISRNFQERKRSVVDIERLENMVDSLASRYKDIADMGSEEIKIFRDLQAQLAACKTAQSSQTKEFTTLQERHASILKSITVSRDERVKELENTTQDFLGLIKQMMNEDVRQETARHQELVRHAAMKEYERLGQEHQYMDKTWDRPILSPETLDLQDKEELVDG